MKVLPLTYNRDLQWDKRLVFGAVEASQQALEVLEPFIRHLTVRTASVGRLLNADMLCATDLAEYLVRQGVAFRQAHEIVGKAIALAQGRGVPLRRLPAAALTRLSPHLTRAALAVLDVRRSVKGKRSIGSTNPTQVARALSRWRARLSAV